MDDYMHGAPGYEFESDERRRKIRENQISMNINEVKKEIYKTNPKASLIKIKKGHLHYETIMESGVVVFQVPYSDIQDGTFEIEMEAKHLIRWLVF